MREVSTQFSTMGRSSKQKINKKTQALNDKLDQMDLIDIYMTFHPKAAECTFFSVEHRIFSKIYYKSRFDKFKNIGIISSFPTTTR